jgi:hypothetical protein
VSAPRVFLSHTVCPSDGLSFERLFQICLHFIARKLFRGSFYRTVVHSSRRDYLSVKQGCIYWKYTLLPPFLPGCKDIRQEDCTQVGVEALGWSFYLVWKPSSQKVPGPSCVLSAPSPEQWDSVGYHVYKPVPIGSYRDQISLLFYSLYSVDPGKILFVNLSSSTFSCTVFLYNVLGWDEGVNTGGGNNMKKGTEGNVKVNHKIEEKGQIWFKSGKLYTLLPAVLKNNNYTLIKLTKFFGKKT